MPANLTTKLGQLVDVLTPDTTNTRIGVANASPTRTLDVTGTGAFSGLLTAAAGVSSTLTTDATSTTTGSIITAGGISTQKALFVGTTSNFAGAMTLSAALTYGGITLSNAVTGTGNMVLSASPTLTGTLTAAATTLSGAITYGGITLSNAVTGTGNMVLSASPTLTGTLTAAAGTFSSTLTSTAHTVTSASATALAVGLNGSTNSAFTVDSSTGLQVAGLKVTGAVTGGTVAVVATDSGSATNLTINAKGTGTIGIGSVSTGAVTITPATTHTGATTLSAALTYGGITLSNAVTGTGNMVLSASPTFTGTINQSGVAATGGSFLGAGGTTTNYNYGQVSNTTGTLRWGVDSSVGGALFTGSSAYAATIGSVSNVPLQLASNSVIRATLDTSGNLCIGNTLGSSPLNVSKTSNGAAVEVAQLRNDGSGANTLAQLGFYAAASNYASILGGYSSGAALTFQTSSTERMRIMDAGVGIGMTPSNILDITQTQNATTAISLLNASAGASALARLLISNGTSAVVLSQFGAGWTTSGLTRQNGTYIEAAGAGGLTLNAYVNQPIYFASNNTEVGRWTSTGLGIGMTAARTLDVTGTFGATGAATFGSTIASGAITSTGALAGTKVSFGTANGMVKATATGSVAPGGTISLDTETGGGSWSGVLVIASVRTANAAVRTQTVYRLVARGSTLDNSDSLSGSGPSGGMSMGLTYTNGNFVLTNNDANNANLALMWIGTGCG